MLIYRPGTRIGGPYEVTSAPLIGDMTVVYPCLDTVTGCPVALKTWRPEILPDHNAHDAFLCVATHWADLGAHPHIVRCHHLLETNSELYLVLELVVKEQFRADATLRSWMSLGALPPNIALLFALQVARGMAHAAQTIPGFVHLDLTPRHLLVGADLLPNTATKRLRVSDFGLTRALAGAALQPVQPPPLAAPIIAACGDWLGGTPEYAAPEQFAGGPVDLRADIYALGAILVEMLTGIHWVWFPLGVDQARLEACRKQHGQGKFLRAAGDLPDALRHRLHRFVAVDPAERCRTWDEAESALESAYAELTGRPVPALRPTRAPVQEERGIAGRC